MTNKLDQIVCALCAFLLHLRLTGLDFLKPENSEIITGKTKNDSKKEVTINFLTAYYCTLNVSVILYLSIYVPNTGSKIIPFHQHKTH